MSSTAVRILMYSHDTYGLGHITRTLRIARALRAGSDRASILVLTGSPVAPYMPLPEGADFVKLPSVVKAGPDLYRSRDLEISFSRIKRMRRDLVRRTAETFRPHLFLVDNVPLGMKSEILPTLKYLRAERPATKIVLDLRDILDDPAVIDAAWERDGVRAVLDEFYDRILILGDPSVFDARREYRLPPEKTIHVGYASPGGPPAPKPPSLARRSDLLAIRRSPRILVTAGGGGDGVDFLNTALDGLAVLLESRSEKRLRPVRIDVVTGPLMDPVERRRISEAAGMLGASAHEFVPDLPARMERADLVMSMAGYNTCCEILAHARAALLVPRVTPRVEQLIRARALRERGLVAVIEPQELSPESIGAATARLLEGGPTIRPESLPEMNGLRRFAEVLGGLYPPCGNGRAPHAIPENGTSPQRGSHGMDGAYWYWPGVIGSTRPALFHRHHGGAS